MKQYQIAADSLKEKIGNVPETAIILGSGLGSLGDELENRVIIPYGEIPNFPQSTAPGHKGRLVSGTLNGTPLLVMQGRFHYYEGYKMQDIVFPIRVFKLLGVKKLIVTNAAGGVNTSFNPGDLMLITDHIKMGGGHPLIGPNLDDFGPRFNDMSEAYNRKMIETAVHSAQKLGQKIQRGVYAFMTGPSFETPAEIRMLRTLGADAVGMSTVPEVITAAHCGLNVLGISCISNMAAGILDQPITSEEVIETGKNVAERFKSLIIEIIGNLN